MNLQVFINPKEAEGHPFELFVIGFVYALAAVLLAAWLFPGYASIILIAITVGAATPLVFTIIGYEAERDKNPLMHSYAHRRAIVVLTLLFFGFVAGYLAGFFILPADLQELAFLAQAETITVITGNFFDGSFFSSIVQNNMRVLFLCIIMSIVFGTGGILILAWNASVMAVALGSFIMSSINAGGPVVLAVSSSLSRYLVHGIPEIIAYFVGGLAGGLIFHSVVRKQWSRTVARDVTVLVLFACVLLVGAALLEVHVTPLLL